MHEIEISNLEYKIKNNHVKIDELYLTESIGVLIIGSENMGRGFVLGDNTKAGTIEALSAKVSFNCLQYDGVVFIKLQKNKRGFFTGIFFIG